jgi:copper chaperone CopZ
MPNKTIFSILILFLISILLPAFAEHSDFEEHDHAYKPKVDKSINATDMAVLPGEAVIIVHGMVCSFCAQGVTRNLSKLPFIDRSKYIKGVKVEIEKQKVTIVVKPENTLDLSQVFKSILKGGYEPVEAYVSDSNGNITVHKADGA